MRKIDVKIQVTLDDDITNEAISKTVQYARRNFDELLQAREVASWWIEQREEGQVSKRGYSSKQENLPSESPQVATSYQPEPKDLLSAAARILPATIS